MKSWRDAQLLGAARWKIGTIGPELGINLVASCVSLECLPSHNRSS